MRILSRIVMLMWEADLARAEAFIRAWTLDKGNGVGVPSLAAFACEVGEQESEESFAGVSEEHAAATVAIRGNAMTAAYLSLDRPELLVPVKAIIRGEDSSRT